MTGTIEQKYIFPKLTGPLLKSWLNGAVQPDGAFAGGRISSVYFDTPCFDLYAEKRGSDYRKTKVRLRWYGAIGDGRETDALVSCYLEVKGKYGATRQKERIQLDVRGGDLHDAPFSSGPVRDAVHHLGRLGWASYRPLVPVMIVQYDRVRFVDPVSRARISLDTQIGCPVANDLYFPFAGPVSLDTGVLEVKGTSRELPVALRPMRSHLTKAAYSKYACCCERLQQPAGVTQ